MKYLMLFLLVNTSFASCYVEYNKGINIPGDQIIGNVEYKEVDKQRIVFEFKSVNGIMCYIRGDRK